jgi:hypothetical protein
MADNDEKGDHREPATLVERAASAGVDVAERLLREGGATPGHISSPSTGSTRPRTSSTRRAPAMASRIGVALLAFL